MHRSAMSWFGVVAAGVVACSGEVGPAETGIAEVSQPMTWIEQQRFAPANLPPDVADFPIALSHKTALVGVVEDDDEVPIRDRGAAFVFQRSGTTWTERQELVVSDGADGDHFGRSVALDGDTALIGATEVDVGAVQNQGAAYVFVPSGATWTEQQRLVASDGESGSNFGFRW
jgi:hypothetical protein